MCNVLTLNDYIYQGLATNFCLTLHVRACIYPECCAVSAVLRYVTCCVAFIVKQQNQQSALHNEYRQYSWKKWRKVGNSTYKASLMFGVASLMFGAVSLCWAVCEGRSFVHSFVCSFIRSFRRPFPCVHSFTIPSHRIVPYLAVAICCFVIKRCVNDGTS